MSFPVTSLYAATFALLVAVLSNIVSAKRGRANISILHSDDMGLALWIRRHGNLIEVVPLMLILMGLAEARALPSFWLHTAGLVFIAARILHVAGLDAVNTKSPLRIAGGIGTQAVMLALAGYLSWSLL
ncbi:MAG: MAPEG family protein [Aestuariivirga sp.]